MSTNTTLNDWVASDPERTRQFAQEQLIVAVAEHLWEQMEQRNLSKSEIAAALGKSKAFITQLLNGTRNMTLRTLADIASALDSRVRIELESKGMAQEWCIGRTGEMFTNVVSALPVHHQAAREYGPAANEVVRMKVRAAA